MDKEKLRKRLLATFVDELAEHVGTINATVLALEGDPQGPLREQHIRELFRSAHSLKGAARAVNVPIVADVCHRLESRLSKVRDGAEPAGEDLFATMLKAADALGDAARRLRDGTSLEASPVARLLVTLSGSDAAPVVETAESPAPPLNSEAAVDGGSIRVSSERVDHVINRVSDLLLAQERLESRRQTTDILRRLARATHARWRRSRRDVRAVVRASGALSARWERRRARALTANESVESDLLQLSGGLSSLAAELAADSRALAREMAPLHFAARRLRMMPLDTACAGLDRAVRDIAVATGKQIQLVIEGGETEIDRVVLEGLKQPLLHLVRNSADHGVEPPSERRAAGKPERATITVCGRLEGEMVLVEVRDDGRGVPRDKLRAALKSRKIPVPADPEELLRTLFTPGLSTARIITDISGRGVGLDVVRTRVEALRGRVDVTSTAGLGSCFPTRAGRKRYPGVY